MQTLKDFQEILKKNNGEDFFQRSFNQYAKNPAKYSEAQDAAIAQGKKKANAVLASCRDYSAANKNHDKDTKTLQSFGGNYYDMESSLIKDELAKANALPVQYRNQSYEANFLLSYPVKSNDGGVRNGYYTSLNEMDTIVLDKFKDTMLAKWSAVGYAADDEFRRDFFSNNTLTVLKNNQPFASSAIPVNPAKADF